ncbi:MAG: hypothetical protein K0V04_14255 [Deltaproteobacteria bacterium]|nr:hypothetical protein [Deltaproteobacteria bacterium]
MSLTTAVLLGLLTGVAAPEPVSEAPAAPEPDEPTPSSSGDQSEAFTRARALHQQGLYDEAAQAYAQAWEQTPAPDVLYDWAHVERLAGRCAPAADLYDRFLAFDHDGPPEAYAQLYYPDDWAQMVARAEQMRDHCREQIQAEPELVAPPMLPAPEPEPVETTTAAPPDPTPSPIPVDGGPPAETEPSSGRPWFRDPAGAALLASGGVLVGIGSGLVIAATIHDARAERRPSHDAFLDRVDQAILEQRLGYTGIGIGAALAVAGGIRYALVRHRAKTQPRVTVGGGPRHTVGLGIRGRF